MKIIFLDIDGVLNSFSYLHPTWMKSRKQGYSTKAREHRHLEIDPVTVRRLNALIKITGAYIVISSAWRVGHSVQTLKMWLGRSGFKHCDKVISKTPGSFTIYIDEETGGGKHDRRSSIRGEEIQLWMDKHHGRKQAKIKKFVILDDGCDMGDLLLNLVRVKFGLHNGGLKDKHIKKATAVLNGGKRRNMNAKN